MQTKKQAIAEVKRLIPKSRDKRYTASNRHDIRKRIEELSKRHNILYSDIWK